MVQLRRHPSNPILEPKPEHPWEERAVFNAAAAEKDGKVHIVYRAAGRPYVSRLGLAISPDGYTISERLPHPIYEPQDPSESRGVEDPRITCLDGRYYMLYTAYDGHMYCVAMAESDDLVHWQRRGIVLPDMLNKDAALFPRKIDGSFCMGHRLAPNMWLAWSDDCCHWYRMEVLAQPRPGTWDSVRIGLSGPPIHTPEGWVVLYHGVDPQGVYRQGIMLLDLDDPRRVVRRQDEPILEPETDYELHGDVPNVVFSCGHVVRDDTLIVYYGGADTVIGIATCPMGEIRDWARGKN